MANTPVPAAGIRFRGRLTWMDLLRGTSVMLVASFHASFLVDPSDGSQSWMTIVNNALSPYRVPTLLVLSGLLLQPSLNKGVRRYLSGKVRHIFWPLLVWAAIFPLAWGDFSDYFYPGYWLDGGYLWFLTVLLTSYSLALITRWIPAGHLSILLLLLALLIYSTSPPHLELLRRHLWYGTYFFVGAAFAPYVVRWQRMPRSVAALTGVVALGWSLFVGLRTADYAPKGHATFFLLSLTGIATLIWIAPRIPRVGAIRLIEWFGRHSIVLYTVHFPAMVVLYRVLRYLGVDDSYVLQPILLAFAVGCAALATHFRRYIAWLFEFPHALTKGRATGGRSRAVSS